MPTDRPSCSWPKTTCGPNITHHTFNDVLPLLMGKYLGPGLLGLGVTAMIAGFMSGMAGNVSAFATVWTYDVYRPLIHRKASDHHYLTMGRWASLLGVLISIATAYALFHFSNILEFLQVLIFFFIVPLFGVVILGMLWKRATPTGGFVGFLTAILVSISMWGYVHTFPDGYRPHRRSCSEEDAVVTSRRDRRRQAGEDHPRDRGKRSSRRPTCLAVEAEKTLPVGRDLTIQGSEGHIARHARQRRPPEANVRVLAPEVTLAGNKETTKFGEDGRAGRTEARCRGSRPATYQ